MIPEWLRSIGRAYAQSIVLIVVAIALTFYALHQPRDFEFSSHEYRPVDDTVCPGDTLTWTVTVHARVPGVLVIARSWWPRGSSRGTEVFDQHPDWTSHIEPGTITARRTAIVPDLSPGPWDLHVGMAALGNGADVYKVPFQVEEGC